MDDAKYFFDIIILIFMQKKHHMIMFEVELWANMSKNQCLEHDFLHR